MKKIFFAFLFISTFCFGQDVVDYRYAQSSVKDQAGRGTCTAFGICAAFEVCPNIPSDLSEQYIFADIKYQQYYFKNVLKDTFVEGETLKNYINSIQFGGLISEEKMPYNPYAPIATNDKDLFKRYMDITKSVPMEIFENARNETYKLKPEQYEYLNRDSAQNIEKIKQALRNGVKAIPVCYRIHEKQWQSEILDLYIETPVMDLDGVMQVMQNNKLISIPEAEKKDPLIKWKIVNGFAKVAPFLKNESTGKPAFSTDGHCVTIVGYNQQGFIIKNSWGKNWCSGGYAIVSYDYHKLFCTEGLILKDFYIQKNGIAGPFDVLKPEQIRLKTMPVKDFGNNYTKLSLLYEGPRFMPELEKINIKFYNQKTGEFISSFEMPTGTYSYEHAYECTLPDAVTKVLTENMYVRAEMEMTYFNGLRKVNAVFKNLSWENETLRVE